MCRPRALVDSRGGWGREGGRCGELICRGAVADGIGPFGVRDRGVNSRFGGVGSGRGRNRQLNRVGFGRDRLQS